MIYICKIITIHLLKVIKPSDARDQEIPRYIIKVNVEFSHTRYRALGPELIPVYCSLTERHIVVNNLPKVATQVRIKPTT